MRINDPLIHTLMEVTDNPLGFFLSYPFVFLAINRSQPGTPIALTALPSLDSVSKNAAMMVCKLRMERISADSYAVAEFAPDTSGDARLFVYTNYCDDDNQLDQQTHIFRFTKEDNPDSCALALLDKDDWLLSDPRLLDPDPVYLQLFNDLTAEQRQLATTIQNHSYFSHVPTHPAKYADLSIIS